MFPCTKQLQIKVVTLPSRFTQNCKLITTFFVVIVLYLKNCMFLSLWSQNAFLAFRRRQGKFMLDNRCVLVHYRTLRYQICKSVYSPDRYVLILPNRQNNNLVPFQEEACSNLTEPFKAYWLRNAPTGLIFNNFTLRPHCIYVFSI